MIILGIDPSICNLGFGIINKSNNTSYLFSGVISTSNSQEISQRLDYIFTQVEALINKYQPMVIAMETVFYKKDINAVVKLSYVRAIIMLLAGKKGINYEEYAPRTIKKTITGSGNASKEQIIKMIPIFLEGVKSSNHDEIDALAIAYTCSILKRELKSFKV